MQKEDLRDRMMVMSNVCTRQGKIEWKKAGLQAARLELEIMQVSGRAGCVINVVDLQSPGCGFHKNIFRFIIWEDAN